MKKACSIDKCIKRLDVLEYREYKILRLRYDPLSEKEYKQGITSESKLRKIRKEIQDLYKRLGVKDRLVFRRTGEIPLL